MDPFSLWLLGGVVLPDAYGRVIDKLGRGSSELRLAKLVHEDLGRYPKRVFRKWYQLGPTKSALVKGGEDSFEVLVDGLVEVSEGRLFRPALPRGRAEEIVRAAVAGFIRTLDPSDGIALLDDRAAGRAAEQERKADARNDALREHIDRRFDSAGVRLLGPGEVEKQLLLLPATVRPLLADATHVKELAWLVGVVTTESPREALVQLVADLPPWLESADGSVLIAAAELCRAYGVRGAAARLFEHAASRSADRGYWLARAAVELEVAGDSDRAREVIDRASRMSEARSVQAIGATLAERFDEALSLLPQDEALEDPFLVLLHLGGLRATERFDDVFDFLESAIKRYPEASGLMIELAWAHLHRSCEPGTTSRVADRERALELGLEARRLRRLWRADAADAVRVACHAALLSGTYERVLELGLAQPDGEALPSEAANREVRLSVAQAAIASGRIDLVRAHDESAPDDFHRAIIQAEFFSQTGADQSELQRAYDAAWSAAEDETHKVLYWLSGAEAGIEVQGEDELEARSDDVPLLVEAICLRVRGDDAGAIQLLRRSRRTEHSVRLLVRSLVAMGDVDGAVDELKAAATRFNEMAHLVRAVEVLGQYRSLDDAATLAQQALQTVPRAMVKARTFLHEVLVEQAGVRQAWGEMASRARAWIDDLGASSRSRWHLALALHNNGDHESAWRILREPPALEPASGPEAQLWIVLAARQNPSPATAARFVDLVDIFPDDGRTAEAAVVSFFGRGDNAWGDVDATTISRFQEFLAASAVDYGSGEEAAIYVVAGDAEELLDQLRPSLEANARAVGEMMEKVQQGWPYGLLAAVGQRPYSTALLHRAAGCLPIATTDTGRRAAEVDAARRALGRSVVLDASTLVVAGHIRGAWPRLRSVFGRVEMPRPAQVDIIETIDGLRRPSDGSLFFDLAVGAIRLSDTDPEVQARLIDHAIWVAAEAGELDITDWPELRSLKTGLDDRVLPWLSALDLAKTAGRPLWCDDLGVRTIALNEGVAAFGTTALLEALVDGGEMTRGEVQGLLRQLREEYAVDLPLDADWLRLSAGSDNYRAGPSAFYFTRPAAWAGNEDAITLWSELALAAGDVEPVRVSGWVQAAAIGLSAVVDERHLPTVLAEIAARGIVLAHFDAEALAACTARVREVARGAGAQNPVPHLMTTLLENLTGAVGADSAARLILSEYLDEEDRAIVRDLVFGVSHRPERIVP